MLKKNHIIHSFNNWNIYQKLLYSIALYLFFQWSFHECINQLCYFLDHDWCMPFTLRDFHHTMQRFHFDHPGTNLIRISFVINLAKISFFHRTFTQDFILSSMSSNCLHAIWKWIPESRIQNPESHLKSRIQNPESHLKWTLQVFHRLHY